METARDRFNVTLNPVHLSWGTLGKSRTNGKRSPLEVYVQIALSDARCDVLFARI